MVEQMAFFLAIRVRNKNEATLQHQQSYRKCCDGLTNTCGWKMAINLVKVFFLMPQGLVFFKLPQLKGFTRIWIMCAAKEIATDFQLIHLPKNELRI